MFPWHDPIMCHWVIFSPRRWRDNETSCVCLCTDTNACRKKIRKQTYCGEHKDQHGPSSDEIKNAGGVNNVKRREVSAAASSLTVKQGWINRGPIQCRTTHLPSSEFLFLRWAQEQTDCAEVHPADQLRWCLPLKLDEMWAILLHYKEPNSSFNLLTVIEFIPCIFIQKLD